MIGTRIPAGRGGGATALQEIYENTPAAQILGPLKAKAKAALVAATPPRKGSVPRTSDASPAPPAAHVGRSPAPKLALSESGEVLPQFDLLLPTAELRQDGRPRDLPMKNAESVQLAYCLEARAALTMELRNTGPQALCYKVKVQNPNRYAVTPAVSFVSPGESATVAIVCAGMHAPPAAGAAVDRFLVKAGTVDPLDGGDDASFWKRPCVLEQRGTT
jgi:hypothetical protein